MQVLVSMHVFIEYNHFSSCISLVSNSVRIKDCKHKTIHISCEITLRCDNSRFYKDALKADYFVIIKMIFVVV